MLIRPVHKGRQFGDPNTITDPGFVNGGSTIAPVTATGPLALNTAAPTGDAPVSAPSLAPGLSLTVTNTFSTSSEVSTAASPPSGNDSTSAPAHSPSSSIPLNVVIGACVGAFVGLAVIICLFFAWYKRSSDKLSAAARRNAESHVDQQRTRAKSFSRLGGSEKPSGDLPPQEQQEAQESDEKNFSMFKKSPSIRTAYTHKTTTDDENAYDLPQLQLKYPALSEQLAFKAPGKPFAAAAAARQESGVSWDGETLGDDSFLSLRSVRVESGTMSPTMIMAKMTPPATASEIHIHKWESAEVLHADEEALVVTPAATMSRNPFEEMAEEQRSRATNPFFNAQDMTRRNSRAVRSRSNSRTSRASRSQSIVRPDSRATIKPITNPFLELQQTPATGANSHTLPSSTALHSMPGPPEPLKDHAMASLIAALDLTKDEVEERLRVVSVQGSMISAYSETEESDIATVREFPLPPGATSMCSL